MAWKHQHIGLNLDCNWCIVNHRSRTIRDNKVSQLKTFGLQIQEHRRTMYTWISRWGQTWWALTSLTHLYSDGPLSCHLWKARKGNCLGERRQGNRLSPWLMGGKATWIKLCLGEKVVRGKKGDEAKKGSPLFKFNHSCKIYVNVVTFSDSVISWRLDNLSRQSDKRLTLLNSITAVRYRLSLSP